MKLTLKLYAGLQVYLPAGSENNRTTIEIADDATANTVIDMFNLPRERASLVLRNGIYLHPEERDNANFTDGDTLAIWPPVAGG